MIATASGVGNISYSSNFSDRQTELMTQLWLLTPMQSAQIGMWAKKLIVHFYFICAFLLNFTFADVLRRILCPFKFQGIVIQGRVGKHFEICAKILDLCILALA